MGRRENILAQSILPSFVGGSKLQALKKRFKLIEEEKKKNVGGKAAQDKTRVCRIQLCKRC